MASSTERISQLAGHLDPRTWSGKGLAAAQVKSDADVVIVAMGRTPYCKAFKGGLKDCPFDVLCYETFKGVLSRADIDPSLIQEVAVGNTRNVDNHYDIRAAALAAGIPHTAPTHVVHRFCASGLQTVRAIANQIQAGEIECGLAVGVESMTNHPKRDFTFSKVILDSHPEAADCIMPMGWTSENVAKEFKITRLQMDTIAARSHSRASQAQKSGKFAEEIFPVTVPDGNGGWKVVEHDDGIREGSTPEGLGKIKPAFPQWEPSQTTGGNASQITDGGAGLLLMRRCLANKLGKKPLAKYVGSAVAGLPPRIMGIGPTIAIPRVLALTGIKPEEVDVYEINEAFASMLVYCQQKLEIPDEKLNPQGGAIALGHPLGSSAGRLVLTALTQLAREGKTGGVAVASACIGLGMGQAGVFINEVGN